MVSWSLAALRVANPPLLEALAARLSQQLPALTPPQLSMALWATARLLQSSGNTLHGMATLSLFSSSRSREVLLRALPGMSPKDLAVLAWSYGAVQASPGDRALQALWARTAAALPYMSHQGVAMVAGAVAQLRSEGAAREVGGDALGVEELHEKRLVRALVVAVLQRMAAAAAAARGPGRAGGDGMQGVRLSGRQGAAWLSSAVCSLARLGPARWAGGSSDSGNRSAVAAMHLLQLSCVHARALLPYCTAREAVPLLWGLGVVARAAAGVELEGPAAQGGAVGVVVGCPGDVVEGLVGVVEEAIRLDAAHAAAGEQAQRHGHGQGQQQEHPGEQKGQQQQQQQQLDGGLLSMFLMACVAHRHRPPPAVLQAACVLLLPHLASLSCHTLCEVVWAVALLQPTDPGAHALLPLHLMQQQQQLIAPLGDSAVAAAPGSIASVGAAGGAGVAPHGSQGTIGRQLMGLGGPHGSQVAARGSSVALHGPAPPTERSAGGVGGMHCAQEGADPLWRCVAGAWRRAQAERRAAKRAAAQRAAERRAAAATAAAATPGATDASSTTTAGVASAGGGGASPTASCSSGGSQGRERGVRVRRARVASRLRLRLLRQPRGLRAAAVARRRSVPGSGSGVERLERIETGAPAPSPAPPGMGSSTSSANTTSPLGPPALAVVTPRPSRRANGKATAAAAGAGTPGTAVPLPEAPTDNPSTAAAPTGHNNSTAQRQRPNGPTAAAHRSPIYPPAREALTRGSAGARLLLHRCLALLGRRLAVERSQLLSLDGLVRLSWAMCVTRMYAPRWVVWVTRCGTMHTAHWRSNYGWRWRV